jgi:hypothetical protein
MLAPSAELPAYIDSTMLSAFRGCPRKFYHEFVLGLRPAETSIDLHAGAVFSATLERFYREIWKNGCDTPTALGRAYTTFLTEWGDFILRKEKHPKTPENMWAAVESYIATYPPRTDSVQPYFVDGAPSFELSFAIPLDFPNFPLHPSGDPFIYVGRFDMLGVWNSMPVVRDEKTAQRLESNWAEKWDLRSQFLGYCWALQHLGIKCNTTIVRGVIITTKDIRQVEAVKTYPQFLIDRWFEQLQRDLVRLRTSFQEGYFDYNLADTCTSYSHCSFMPLCSSPNPENWYANYVVRKWNPLDRNPIADVPSSIAVSPVSTGPLPGTASSASAPTPSS